MKIRNGFISNSSSSSFIIGVKNTTLHSAFKKLEKEELKKGGLFSGLIKESLKILESESNKFDNKFVQDEYSMQNIEEFLEDGGEEADMIADLQDKGFTVYVGSLSSDGEPVESMLCDIDLNYESPDFVIIHNGGY